MSSSASPRWPTLALVGLVVAVGPLALWSSARPTLEVRQRPWNQTSAGLPNGSDPLAHELAPGQLFQLPSELPSSAALAPITGIDVALVDLVGGPETVALELRLSAAPSPTGPFTEVARSRVTTSRDSLVGASHLHFPIDLPGSSDGAPYPGSWHRFQLTQVGKAPIAAIVRRRGHGGVNRGWGPVVKPVERLEGKFQSPMPGLTGVAFHATTPLPEVGAEATPRSFAELPSEARKARLTLRADELPAPPLRVVELEVPRNLEEAWLHFDFEPVEPSYRRAIDFVLELPAGVALRGAKGRPSLRTYHGGGLNPSGGALAGTTLDPRRDLVFRVWTGAPKGVLESLETRQILGLALGLLMLVGLGLRLARTELAPV